MSRSTIRSTGLLARPAVLLAAAGATGALLLSGCSAGQVTQTAAKTPSVPGINVEKNGIAIRNAAIAFPANGEFAPGGAADLSLRIVNTGSSPDRLVAASSDGAGYVQLVSGNATPSGSATPSAPGSASPSATPAGTPAGTPSATPSATASPSAPPTTLPSGSPDRSPINLAVPPGNLVTLDEGGQRLVLQNLTKAIRPGELVKVTLVFEKAGEFVLELAVAPPSTPQPRGSAVVPEHGGAPEGEKGGGHN